MRCCVHPQVMWWIERYSSAFGLEAPEPVCVDVDVALPPGVIVLGCFLVPYSKVVHKENVVTFFLADGRSPVKVALDVVKAGGVRRTVKPGKWIKIPLAALVSNDWLKPAYTS